LFGVVTTTAPGAVQAAKLLTPESVMPKKPCLL
jgi:hypothetical protein